MSDRWRPMVVVASGVLVGILTAFVAFNVFFAATWSSIHGGMSEAVLAVLSVVTMTAPLATGFLAAWTTNRWLSSRKTPDS